MKPELEIHEQELGALGEEEAAKTAVLERFGNTDDLAGELQASVPRFERMVFRYFVRKEMVMNRVLWILGVVMFATGEGISFRYANALTIGSAALLSGLIFAHLLKANNVASRMLGRRWPWYVGFVALAFGPAVILLAAAKLSHGGAMWFIVPLVLGSLIMIGGAGFVVLGIQSWRARIA